MTLRIWSAASLGLALVVLTLSVVPPTANAGTVHLYSCRQPSGMAAPAAGWTAGINAPVGYVDAYNTCSQGGGLGAQLEGGVAHPANAAAQWTFSPPAGVQIVRAALWRTSSVGPDAPNVTPLTYVAAPGPGFTSHNVIDRCLRSEGCAGNGDGTFRRVDANRLQIPEDHLGENASITLNASCGGVPNWTCPGNPGGAQAVAHLVAADIELLDRDPPVVAATSGDLVVGGVLSGVRTLSVRASDVGLGLDAVGLAVDGKTVAEQSFPDSTGGRCVPAEDPGDGTRAYLWPVPCPTSGSTTLEVDTRTISDGAHTLTTYVTDASGSRAVIGEASTIVHNSGRIGPGSPMQLRGDPNGSPVTDDGRLTAGFRHAVSRRCSKASYRKRHRNACRTRTTVKRARYSSSARDSVVGRLRTPDGAPIAGARVVVLLTPHRGAGAQTMVASATTSSSGRYTIKLRRSVSATLTVAWMARANDTVPAVARRLSHRIAAHTTLRWNPRTGRKGRAIRFSGRLTARGGGQAALPANVPVVVRVRYGGRWSTIANASTDTAGRWTAHYRWPKTAQGRFSIRAEVRRASRFPYEAGRTGVVRVRVR